MMRRKSKPPKTPAPRISVCILAGGLSTRMGRKKDLLKLRGRTLLQHIRAEARATGWPVRILRRDLVRRCGPLGGILTGLKTCQTDAEIFLACDMPFVSQELIMKLTSALGPRQEAVFTFTSDTAGFPFLIRITALPLIEQQIAAGQFSLQALARKLKAKLVRVPAGKRAELFNINTPQDWETARQMNQTTIWSGES